MTETSAAALQGKWIVTFARDVDISAGQTVTLEFNDNGTFFGEAPCHSFSGPVQIDGDTLMIPQPELYGDICEDDAVMKADQAYLHLIGRLSRFEIADDVALTLFFGEEPAIRAQRAIGD